MNIKIIFFSFFFLPTLLWSMNNEEDEKFVKHIFPTTRVINSHSVEMLEKKSLDFKILHRFGDIAGANGGVSTLFGIDNASDIQISFEYGLTDKLILAIGRNKGGGLVKQLWNGYVKYSLVRQTIDNKMPFSITLFSSVAVSGMKASPDPIDVTAFSDFQSRISYASQLLIARKFGKQLSIQLMPTYVHRNFVAFGDENGLFSMGGTIRLRLSKLSSILVESFYTFSEYRKNAVNTTYYQPFAIAYEIETYGHVFHINFSNATGILLNDFIPYTTSNWFDGGFRFGFSISRLFWF